LALAALLALPAFAQEMTKDEETMLREMRKAAKEQGVTLTPEMERTALDAARHTQARVLGIQAAANAMRTGSGGMQAAPAAPVAAVPVAVEPGPAAAPISTTALTLPPKEDAKPTRFEDLTDGFKANGKLWLDPEGATDTYATNAATGEVTYLVASGGDRFIVKHANVNSRMGPVTVGHLTRSPGRQEFEGVDGQRLAVQHFILTGRALLGYRTGALFFLEFGEAVKPYALPEGFQVASWQTGDVSGTGYILIYRKRADDSPGGFLKYTKATLGKNTDSDVMFFNLQTGDTVPVEIAGLKIHDGANRYTDTHLHDDEHIYWRARWYATDAGPIAMVKEDGPSRLTVINLQTGARAVAFERKLGLGDWEMYPTDGGKLRFEGSWAFKKHEIEDVAALLKQ